MNKEFFQQIFQAVRGYVYRYTGTVPGDQSVAHYVTDAFAIVANTNLLNTMVIELSTYSAIVIYANSDENLIDSAEFELITNLIPDVIPVVESVVEEITPPSEG